MRYLTIIFCAVLVAFSLPQAQARMIHVPADSSTIQGGINGATNGDTVLVANGTYTGDGNGDIDFGGKLIMVKSENGPQFTIIDCQGSQEEPGRAFYFHNGEDSTAVVEGFTIQGGYIHEGGGIFCNNSSPTVINCTFSGNHVGFAGMGGGMCCRNSSPILIGCTFIGNICGVTGIGGGMCCWHYSSPRLVGCTFSRNLGSPGAGMFCSDFCSPILKNCSFIGDSALGTEEGVIYCTIYCSPALENCIVAFSVNGPAITCFDTTCIPTLTYCDIYGNPQGDWVGCIADQYGINGNICCCPMFCHPDTGNYFLAENSCCVGAGQGGVHIGAFGVGCDYLCGDASGDRNVDVGDVIHLINYLFTDASPPDPLGAGDANCDGLVDIGDVVYLINYLFIDGPPPCEP